MSEKRSTIGGQLSALGTAQTPGALMNKLSIFFGGELTTENFKEVMGDENQK